MKMEMFKTYFSMKRTEYDEEDAIYVGSSIRTSKQSKVDFNKASNSI